MKEVSIIGYGGHAVVVIDALQLSGYNVTSYFDDEEKEENPFTLNYLGKPDKVCFSKAKGGLFFVAIGDNAIRSMLYKKAVSFMEPINAIHPTSVISGCASLGKGIYVGPNAVVNAFAEIGDGVICNTASIVEHHCKIGDFVHMAPGGVLLGGVDVGEYTFLGAKVVVNIGTVLPKDTFLKSTIAKK